jgi:hypothetical protein
MLAILSDAIVPWSNTRNSVALESLLLSPCYLIEVKPMFLNFGQLKKWTKERLGSTRVKQPPEGGC